MGKETGISWTDHTFNPWHGCTKVSPGCDNCYAEVVDSRWGGPSHWGKGKPRRTFGVKHWNAPLKWDKDAAAANVKRNVFCGSMCDVMDDEAPDGELLKLWDLINCTPNLLWQLLTKRPSRYVRKLPRSGVLHNNVILMATVEMQKFYAPRIKALHNAARELESRNACFRPDSKRVLTGISYEPALGPLSIREYPALRPHWLICGGESGDDRRPFEQGWAENVKDECEEFGVAFYMKQMSARTPDKAADLIPAHLLIRKFPGEAF